MTNTARLVVDPLWQALCPSWTTTTPAALARRAQSLLPLRQRAAKPTHQRRQFTTTRALAGETGKLDYKPMDYPNIVLNPLRQPKAEPLKTWQVYGRHHKPRAEKPRNTGVLPNDLMELPTGRLYTHLRRMAVQGEVRKCRMVAEMLIRDRRERPNTTIYHALILSNTSHEDGAAWRVAELLDDMHRSGIPPDSDACHAALRVLAVHPDHLLRADVLAYMRTRYYQVNVNGAHDVAAGLLREGSLEQGLERIEEMQREGLEVNGWLYDIAVYMMLLAGEIPEAHRIMKLRIESGQLALSRSLWWQILDRASEGRHYEGTDLVWRSQVNQGYLNPSSGMCMNILATAAQAGDAVMATEVFSHLSKRGSPFQPIHYELLIKAYMHDSKPDLRRALSILSVMGMERMRPSAMETRSMYAYLRDKPALLAECLSILRDLYADGRVVPLAALNLLIECHAEQHNLSEALKLYKQIHTFVPEAEGSKKSFADAETFDHLFKACREVDPPDARMAGWLVSEMIALGVLPTAKTYDRLILVFLTASSRVLGTRGYTQTMKGRGKSRWKSDTQQGQDEANANEIHAAEDREQISASASPQESAQEQNPNLDIINPTSEPEIKRPSILPSPEEAQKLIDFSFRHFDDMHRIKGWLPRLGTLRLLALALASLGDARCWEVLQVGHDNPSLVPGWLDKGRMIRIEVERVWKVATGSDGAVGDADVNHDDAFTAKGTGVDGGDRARNTHA